MIILVLQKSVKTTLNLNASNNIINIIIFGKKAKYKRQRKLGFFVP